VLTVAKDWFLFLPALLFAVAVALWLAWLIVRRKGGVSDASCAACGYLVIGLTTPICPECGSDLSKVGVRLPGDARPMPRLFRAVLFTLVYFGLVALVWPVIEPLLPRWYSGTTAIEMAQPRSQSFHSVIAVASGSGWTEQVKFDHVDLTIVPSTSGTRTLGIDINADDAMKPIAFSGEDEQSIVLRDIRELTPERVFAWMIKFAGPDSPLLRDEAASIAAETIKLASADVQVQHTAPDRTPFGALNFRQAASIPMLPWRAVAPVALIGLILWAIGLMVILRRNSRPEPALV
jgi:hypothetical protein